MNLVMISYAPLLIGEAGQSDLDPSCLQRIFEQSPNGLAEACVWLNHGGQPMPCLIMERAEDIAEHLKVWAEGKPEEWFQLIAAEQGPLYGLALMPNLIKSAERFRLAYQLRNGFPLPQTARIQALFRALHFGSSPGHMFERVKSRLGKRVSLALMDSAKVNRANIAASDWEHGPVVLGEFSFSMEEPDNAYVVEMLKG